MQAIYQFYEIHAFVLCHHSTLTNSYVHTWWWTLVCAS